MPASIARLILSKSSHADTIYPINSKCTLMLIYQKLQYNWGNWFVSIKCDLMVHISIHKSIQMSRNSFSLCFLYLTFISIWSDSPETYFTSLYLYVFVKLIGARTCLLNISKSIQSNSTHKNAWPLSVEKHVQQ
jgi:hypothetical protein